MQGSRLDRLTERKNMWGRDPGSHARRFDCVIGTTAMKSRISVTQESLAREGGLSPRGQ